ncbi:MAG: WD40/YVTN/BNR-like repeat-containing protein [Spirosomataceae bacterium]
MKKLLLLLAVFAHQQLIAQVNNNRASTGTDRQNAFKKHDELISKSPYKNLNWRLLGPDNTSGRATDVWGIEGNKNIIYAGFATGGFWKTEDAGKTWMPLMDKEATQAVGNFAVSKSNPNVIYVGTGEANIFRASLPGVGMYKSTDAGKTWQHIGLENTSTIARVVIHPNNPNVVYVAASGNEWSYNADRGVYQTTDGGKTWKKILYKDEKTGCIDLLIDPSDPNTLYASMWNRIRKRWSDPTPEDGDYLYKTTDGGKTWKIIKNGLPDTKNTGRIGLAMCAAKPNVLYAYVDNHTPKRQGNEGELDSYGRPKELVILGAEVYKSSDKGESWTKMSENDKQMETFGGTYGWVFSQIRVDPVDENRVFIMGLNIAESLDGGKTWKVLRGGNTPETRIHGDNHGMWIDPSDTNYILNANDGGVVVSYDGGKTWKNFFKEIPTTQFYNIHYDMATPFNVQGSVQDEGSMGANVTWKAWSGVDDKKNGWHFVPGGEGSIIAIDPTNPDITYSSAFYGRIQRSDLSKSGKERTKNITIKKAEDEETHRGEWLAYTLISKYDNKTIYHGMQYLFKSTDMGETWKRISPDLSNNDKNRMGKLPYAIAHQAITAIAESPFKQGTLYVGTDDGNVHITVDDGKTWTKIMKGIPVNSHVSRLEASQYQDGVVYLTLSDRREDNITPYIYKSTDFGKTWVSISGDLPASPVNVIREDPKDKNSLYCGIDLGIYASKNGGKNWESMQANLPKSVSVQDLFIHPRDNTMVIATYGRGVWVLEK